tara:strand:- start:8678 stop:9889 length:1212 start_codon:yes stop_codon:yes gene_type:complete
MQVDSNIINIPGEDKKVGDLRMKAVYIPIANHPSSEEFVKFLQQPKEEQWKNILLAQQLIENKIDIEKSWENNDYQREIREQKKGFNDQVKKLREKNKKLKVDKLGLEEIIDKNIQDHETKLEQARKTCKIQTENLYKNKIEVLEDEAKELKNALSLKNKAFYEEISSKIDEAREKHKVEMEDLRKEKNKELEDIREKLYTNTASKKIAANKGADGEELVSSWLTKYFPKAEIEDTAQQGGKGDMLMTHEGKKYLVEVKTDKKNVQKVGVKKFEKEMMKLKEIDGGLFLSLNAGVSGKSDWQVQMYGKKPALYLCNVTECPRSIVGGVDFLYQIMNTKMNVENVKGRAKQIRNFKKILLQNTSKLKNQISDNNDALTKHIDRINEQVVEFVDQMINEETVVND